MCQETDRSDRLHIQTQWPNVLTRSSIFAKARPLALSLPALSCPKIKSLWGFQPRSTTETIGIWTNLGWICVNSSYGWATVVDVHSLLIMFRASCESSISISSHLISSSNLTSLLHHYPIVVPWSILHCPIKHHSIIMSIMHVSASDCNKIFSRPFRFAAVALQETEGLCLLQGCGGTSCQPICPSHHGHHGTCSIPRRVMLLKQLATAWPRR